MNNFINCKSCGKRLTGKQTHFCSLKCKNEFHQSYKSQKIRGLTRKIQLFKIAGSKCCKCGYDKNISALAFHHINLNKEFKLDMRSLSNRKLITVMKEFKKCQLLCHNCHSELHNPDLDLEYLSLSRLL